MCYCGAQDCPWCGPAQGFTRCPGHDQLGCLDCLFCEGCGRWFYDEADYAEPVPCADEEAPPICRACLDKAAA